MVRLESRTPGWIFTLGWNERSGGRVPLASCGHKDEVITPSIAWRREAWKEEALDDLPWKDERGAVVNQTNIGTVSKATLRKLPRDGLGRKIACFSVLIPSWTAMISLFSFSLFLFLSFFFLSLFLPFTYPLSYCCFFVSIFSLTSILMHSQDRLHPTPKPQLQCSKWLKEKKKKKKKNVIARPGLQLPRTTKCLC